MSRRTLPAIPVIFQQEETAGQHHPLRVANEQQWDSSVLYRLCPLTPAIDSEISAFTPLLYTKTWELYMLLRRCFSMLTCHVSGAPHCLTCGYLFQLHLELLIPPQWDLGICGPLHRRMCSASIQDSRVDHDKGHHEIWSIGFSCGHSDV